MPKLTPEAMLSAPRYFPTVPNADGTLALYTQSQYSFDSHSKTQETRILNISTGESTLFSDDQKNAEACWFTNDKILYLKIGESGTEFWIGSAVGERNPYLAGKAGAPLSELKIKTLDDGSVAVAAFGHADGKGKLTDPEAKDDSKSTAREWEGPTVRMWEVYTKKSKHSIFYSKFEKQEDGKYKLHKGGFVNTLKGTGFESPWHSGISGIDGDSFAISKTGLVFSSMKPSWDRNKGWKTDPFFVPLETFTEDPTPEPKEISTFEYKGTTSSFSFSADGKSLVFLRGPDAIDYSAIARILYIADITNSLEPVEVYTESDSNDPWDRNPRPVQFSNDAKNLYLCAEEEARCKLFAVPLESNLKRATAVKPKALTQDGWVTAFLRLTDATGDDRILVNQSNMIDMRIVSIVDASNGETKRLISGTNDGANYGISSSQIEEFWHAGGGGDYKCQSWLIKPSDFDPNKKYPLALQIHGGPASCWPDSWSTRWNAVVFAEEGHIVVRPNWSGSTGFGQAFTDAVYGSYGGRPLQDIEACLDYLQSTPEYNYIDFDRATAAGGSYGGYMVNWMMGQPIAKRFKAMISHDGLFALYNLYSCDLTSSNPLDFKAHLWEDIAQYDKWDPAQHTHNWSTPLLVIHSDNDFRCNITEGLAAYNVCQLRGVESRFLNFPDEGHWVLKPENSLVWNRNVLGWMNRYAKNEGEGRVRLRRANMDGRVPGNGFGSLGEPEEGEVEKKE